MNFIHLTQSDIGQIYKNMKNIVLEINHEDLGTEIAFGPLNKEFEFIYESLYPGIAETSTHFNNERKSKPFELFHEKITSLGGKIKIKRLNDSGLFNLDIIFSDIQPPEV